MSGKVGDEMICLYPHPNGATVDVWEWISDFVPHFKKDAII